MTEPETFDIRGDMIRLGQFLKFAGIAESGAHAGSMITDGDVLVDGVIETRRGRQLGHGALVEVRLPGTVMSARVG